MERGTFVKFAVLGLLCASGVFAYGQSDANSGQALFKARCALCHGEDGKGKTNLGQQLKAFDLNSEKVQKNSNAQLKQVVLEGKGNMPPFQAQLNAEQVNAILKYVRHFGKKK
ncbi:MAG TPA: cytochrome c [Terriglobales bacterium]|jgi:mono/diheme cytochrome c family protein